MGQRQQPAPPILRNWPESSCRPSAPDYARRMQLAYPPSADGSTLLPFQRMFIVASLPG
ncbi:conserved hypothetical protein [Ricinus communis]|uniref:Uncharacterized protein n=1 Tax=Ricinus communis TaxID=3988 RepID=B9T9C4_RICCO|nr:conserved hypothetical protein [Ricinus communis]